jgi:hypothetical protein
MFASRRYSVQRHINNKHSVGITPIPFVEYIAGRRYGTFPPAQRPNFGIGTSSSANDLTTMIKELERTQRERIIEQVLPPAGDPSYGPPAEVLKKAISLRTQKVLLKLIQEDMPDLNNLT